ncbi:MAG: metallophosphoesterase family protein [Bryobacteraceae bacterium]|jgi:putative phosphoesterase
MRVAILSDIHDNVWKLAAALKVARTADALLCLGDLCSPFVVHQLGGGFAGPIHILFGNNDGDPFRIATNARRYPQIAIHAEWFCTEFGGRSLAANHYDNIGRAVAAGGQFDVVCFGHNHRYEITPMGKTLAINPGPIMGATFAADGSRTDVASTLVTYDTVSGQAERVEV